MTALLKFDGEWPWPSFQGHWAKRWEEHCTHNNFWQLWWRITKFIPHMPLMKALLEFDDEWPWPIFVPRPTLVGRGILASRHPAVRLSGCPAAVRPNFVSRTISRKPRARYFSNCTQIFFRMGSCAFYRWCTLAYFWFSLTAEHSLYIGSFVCEQYLCNDWVDYHHILHVPYLGGIDVPFEVCELWPTFGFALEQKIAFTLGALFPGNISVTIECIVVIFHM